MNSLSALKQYRQIGVHSAVSDASPHRLIQLLMQGALDRLAQAKGLMQQGDIAGKGNTIGSAIAIIGGLRGGLDAERGQDLARNLDALYDYMQRTLLEANVNNNSDQIDEVVGLLKQIKEAWDMIGPSN